jgi:hypothetical protein
MGLIGPMMNLEVQQVGNRSYKSYRSYEVAAVLNLCSNSRAIFIV